MKLGRTVYSSRNALLAMAVSFLIAGCGNNLFSSIANKNSTAANNTAVQLALDSGDSSGAVGLLGVGSVNKDASGNLTSLPDGMSAASAQQLASAYMGLAGLNTVTLAQHAATVATSNSTQSSQNFATISSIFPSLTSTNLINLNNAIFVMQHMPTSKPTATYEGRAATLTKDQSLQLGIAEITASIIAIGITGTPSGFDSVTGLPKWCNGNCTLANVSTLLATALPAGVTVPSVTSPTLGDFIGYYLVDASKNVLSATDSTNQLTKVVNNVVYNVQNSGTSCSSAPPSGWSVSAITGGQLTTFIQNCLK